MTAPEPGIYPDIPDAEYRAWDAAAQSDLKLLARSPAHLKWRLDHPEEPTEALMIGAAFHDLVLRPDVFSDRWVEFCGDRKTKAGKDEWASILASGRRPLKAEGYRTIAAMRDKLILHPSAGPLLEGCKRRELSLVWDDEATAVRCKARLDALEDEEDGSEIVVDLKTAQDASKEVFSKAIFSHGYHVQAAHYLAGARCLGFQARYFVIVAIEKEPPHCLRVYELHGEAVDAGTVILRPLLEMWARYVLRDEWPEYPPDPVPISLPPWAWKQNERAAADLQGGLESDGSESE